MDTRCGEDACSEPAVVCLEHHLDLKAEVRALKWQLRQAEQAGPTGQMTEPGVAVHFSHFEAAMVLCVLAVAKGGPSRFDAEDLPLRREALERAYAKLGARLGAGEGAKAGKGNRP